MSYTNVTPATHLRMRAVKRRNTNPELQVRRTLHALGYRFRLHDKRLPGTPDVVLPRHGKVIFVHGCFWHGHERCRRAKLPVNNAAIWKAKIDGNQRRDESNLKALRELGWDVLIVWECEVSKSSGLETRLRNFLEPS